MAGFATVPATLELRLDRNHRRLVVRYDGSLKMYQAFLHTACFMMGLPEGFEIPSTEMVRLVSFWK